MHNSVKNLLKIKENVKVKSSTLNISSQPPKIIAVSKTFNIDQIMPLIEHGHQDFGENKVQEAQEKWSEIKKINDSINLHLIGKLQTNKVKAAVSLFDYIHSVDNEKLAEKISKYQKEINKSLKIFIQVNIGNEEQKSGITKNKVSEFYEYCKSLNLNIVGLMCIPPFDKNSVEYFKEMQFISNKLNLKELSMGMSSDYLTATENNATFLRIGSSIFGNRN